MATYKGIQGFTIQNLSADPSNPIEGEMWYNSTSNVWKVEELTTAGSWATGNNMNTARRLLGSATSGTQTAALAFGGGWPTPVIQNVTEEYNGSSWANSNNLNTGRTFTAGAGTQTAGLAFGGQVSGTATAGTFAYTGAGPATKTITVS